MPRTFSIAQRSNKLNAAFAGLACALTLTLTVGPALAGEELGRVEVRGRMVEAPVRYDVRAGCSDIETQLQDALQLVWLREARYGEVKVQLLMQGNEVADVTAKGINNTMAREVRRAVARLDCGTKTVADAQIYRFSVDFVDPHRRDTQVAGARSGVRLAYAKD